MAGHIPLLPSEEEDDDIFQKCLKYLEKPVPPAKDISEAFTTFLKYLNRQYSTLNVSVYNSSERTNNCAEQFHSQLKNMVGLRT